MTGSSSRSARLLELYDRPANLFVAAFIGSPSMNLLNGTDHRRRVRNRGRRGLADRQHTPPIRTARRSVLGIRPEHIRLDDNGLKAR